MSRKQTNPNSLANLKQRQIPTGAKRMNFYIAPENQTFLSQQENKTETVNQALRLLYSANRPAPGATLISQSSDTLYNLEKQNDELCKQIQQLEAENASLRQKWRTMNLSYDEKMSDDNQAVQILLNALQLKANAGGAIKASIREALDFLDDEWQRFTLSPSKTKQRKTRK